MSGPDAIWLDMQLPPGLCAWLKGRFGLPFEHLAAPGMDRSPDDLAFRAAAEANAAVLTKDADLVRLVQSHGPPPAVLWLRCGNCSTPRLRGVLEESLGPAIDLIRGGEPLVEIADLSSGRAEGG